MMKQEQDLELKLRFMRLLWNMGYFVRKNITVSEFRENSDSFTDVDVIGIKIDEEFNTEFLICECKSGQAAKTKERLFWLNGLKNYLSADKCIFLRSKINPLKYQILANKLNITIISENEFVELEKAYLFNEPKYFGSFDQNQLSIENSFKTLKKFAPEIHNYIRTEYWADTSPYRIHTLIKCCKNLKKLNSLSNQVGPFFILYSLSELSLALIQFSKKVITTPKEYRHNFILQELQGGKLEYQHQKELVGSFYDFMAKEIYDKYKSKYPITKSEFIDGLFSPPYTKYIIDLIDRMCRNPKGFFCIPKIIDCMAHNCILKDKVVDLPSILGTNYNLEHVQKALVDFMSFAERTELLSNDLLEQKNTKISDFF